MTVKEASVLFKKDPSWIRAGIISGWLPIGIATRNGQKVTDISDMNIHNGRINYYISDKKIQEYVECKGGKNGK